MDAGDKQSGFDVSAVNPVSRTPGVVTFAGQNGLGTVLQGYVVNTSSYDVHSVRILVDMLNAAGETTSQRVAWVPGTMNGATRLFFEVPVDPAPTYRVRVFDYERLELPSIMR